MVLNQRKDFRFLTRGNVMFSGSDGHLNELRGGLIDISMGGLAFEYVSGERLNQESLLLDIIIPENKVCLSEIPCNIVYDIPRYDIGVSQTGYVHRCFRRIKSFLSDRTGQSNEPREQKISDQNFMIKRCGVNFEILSKDKKSQLEIFLEEPVRRLRSLNLYFQKYR
ncbi:PilZ domain-containing protein [Desulfonema magnum]|nr:PilZ domain-containing protein [Desulfonema magnum]